MKRRAFIKRAGLAAAGVIAAPYILPSGRLFAATGSRKVNHVVFCLFGGGIRNIESVQKAEGNLMKNLLNGNESISNDILAGMDVLPLSPLSMPLQNYGTLFRQFRYAEGHTGHFNAHTAALTGVYTKTLLSPEDRPQVPTVFEFYNKHHSSANNNAWWISNSLGPYATLSYSDCNDYGSSHQAQFASSLNADHSNEMSSDMQSMSYAEDVIKQHKPQLIVVNMQDADIGHTSFTAYCNNISKADYAVAQLWNTIQNTPGMADDTILIVAPEHGRNLHHNSMMDEYGRYALDHTAESDFSGDQTARDIFCLVVGPSHVVKQGQVINERMGETIEIVPTIANILGFEEKIPKGMLKRFAACDLQAAFT